MVPALPSSLLRVRDDETEPGVRLILESISDGFCALDRDWRFMFLNEAAHRILAPNMENPSLLLGQGYWDAFPGNRGTLLEREYRRAVAEVTPVEFEHFHTPWSRWFAVRAFPIRGGGLSIYFSDITERKQAAEALRTSELKYRALFDSIDEGFCLIEMIWDDGGNPVDYRFIEVNPAFEKQTGLINSAGRTAREIMPGLEPHWFETYGRVAQTNVPVRFEQAAESMGRWFSVYAFCPGDECHNRVALLFTDITERRRAQEDLALLNAESRARLTELQTLLDVIPVGIAIGLDRDCEHIRLNPAFANVLGLQPSDNGSMTAPEHERPVNFRCLDDQGQEVAARDLPMQVAAREGREVRDWELNIAHQDGRRVRLLEYAAPLFDEHGVPRGSVGAFVDITERRQVENRERFLLQLEEAVRPLSDPGEIVAAAARLLGMHLLADRCAYAEVEADEDTFDLQGDFCRDVPSIVGRYTFTQFGAEVLRLMRANQPYVVADIETHEPPPEDLVAYRATLIQAVICVPLHKDGKFVAAMAVHQKTPRSWTADEIALVLHVANRCWEALERARSARELVESEARFRQMADLMPQVVWLARPDGVIDYYNRRWYDFSGAPAEAIGDASWSPVLHPHDLQHCSDQWYHCVRTGEPYEVRHRWRDHRTGGYRWFLGRAMPMRSESGEIIRWYGTSTDINDLVRAEEEAKEARAEAERASRAKDEFLATLSHELRTPLTPVLLTAAALQDEEQLPNEVREQLGMIRRNIELEARLIDDLLDITRISRGKLPLRAQECEVHSLVALALEIVGDDARAKAIMFDLKLSAGRTHLQGDPARLQQVFWNLFKNAVKFTPVGGRIAIHSLNEEANFVLEVSDTGIGIARESLERIFLPFEQASAADSRRFGGLGLGLSISKTIVEMHGGKVCASSAGPGQGATFRVELPGANRRINSEGDVTSPETAQVATAPMRLLLVEDHEPTLAVLQRLLNRAGHAVATASSVAAALELAAREPFDALISDIGLPDGTGVELMRTMRSQHGLRGIALSGYGMEEDLTRSLEAGFVAHLTKPVDLAQLRRALAALASAGTLNS